MRELFYGILSFILIIFFLIEIKNPSQLQQSKHNGGVVIEKEDHFFIGYYMNIKYENDSIETEHVYQIFYDRYEVGDTIKPLK